MTQDTKVRIADLERQKIVSHNMTDWDTIGIWAEDDAACAVIFQVRDGRFVGSQNHFIGGVLHLDKAVITGKVLPLYYASSTFVPREIDLQCLPDEEQTIIRWLDRVKDETDDGFSENDTAPTKFRLPQRGQRLQLLKIAEKNACLLYTSPSPRDS